MAVPFVLLAAFLCSRHLVLPHLLPKYLARLAQENHPCAWISPPQFIHTPRNMPSAIRGLKDDGISRSPIECAIIFRTDLRRHTPSEAHRSERCVGKPSPLV